MISVRAPCMECIRAQPILTVTDVNSRGYTYTVFA